MKPVEIDESRLLDLQTLMEINPECSRDELTKSIKQDDGIATIKIGSTTYYYSQNAAWLQAGEMVFEEDNELYMIADFSTVEQIRIDRIDFAIHPQNNLVALAFRQIHDDPRDPMSEWLYTEITPIPEKLESVLDGLGDLVDIMNQLDDENDRPIYSWEKSAPLGLLLYINKGPDFVEVREVPIYLPIDTKLIPPLRRPLIITTGKIYDVSTSTTYDVESYINQLGTDPHSQTYRHYFETLHETTYEFYDAERGVVRDNRDPDVVDQLR